jgi:hypothetical protein
LRGVIADNLHYTTRISLSMAIRCLAKRDVTGNHRWICGPAGLEDAGVTLP